MGSKISSATQSEEKRKVETKKKFFIRLIIVTQWLFAQLKSRCCLKIEIIPKEKNRPLAAVSLKRAAAGDHYSLNFFLNSRRNLYTLLAAVPFI